MAATQRERSTTTQTKGQTSRTDSNQTQSNTGKATTTGSSAGSSTSGGRSDTQTNTAPARFDITFVIRLNQEQPSTPSDLVDPSDC